MNDRKPDRATVGVADLIRLARDGKEEALAHLLASYRNYLRMLAATCIDRDVRRKADASDVVQEALLKAHQSFDDFRGTTEAEWGAWVRQILVRSLADLRRHYTVASRKVGRERSLEASIDRSSRILQALVPAKGPTPSEQAQDRERGVILADALAELEPEDSEVLILRNFRELPWEEIGERMERSPDAARMLWVRALKRLGGLVKQKLA